MGKLLRIPAKNTAKVVEFTECHVNGASCSDKLPYDANMVKLFPVLGSIGS